ncbi:MAG: 2-dehydro-3-deoxygalactonokinase [Roseibium sp.]
MTSDIKASWIAADWGTTNLRVWALDQTAEIITHRCSDRGMGKLSPEEFEPALLELIDDLLDDHTKTSVIICGMAGSRQGWAEAPYKTTPCTPPDLRDATQISAKDRRLIVHILPGIKQLSPPDVMRGEETQIAGFLAKRPGFTGTLCLPGTHTKWVALTNGRIDRFRTCMSGETFALFSEYSVLRHGLSDKVLDRSAFTTAVVEVAANPEILASELFGIRAAGLVSGLSPEAARGRLSGLLIGAEVAAVSKEFELQNSVLLGSDKIAGVYADALTTLGYNTDLSDADAITLQGLSLAYNSTSKVPS